jgi:hypothetical protein
MVQLNQANALPEKYYSRTVERLQRMLQEARGSLSIK